ncbi:VanZ family protein [Bacillus subtilis]|uniref:VanZ family protein n=1 Tax=Bacillus subtilis TaxID=1423 RepID=UPI0032DFD955
MTTQTLPMVLLFLIFIICEIVYLIIKKFALKEKLASKRTFITSIFIFYFLMLLKLVFFPITFGPMAREMSFPSEAYFQFIPFKTIMFYVSHLGLNQLIQFVGNILLLAPLALYLNTLWRISIVKNIFIAFLSPLLIETIQGIINSITGYPNKVSDIDDVISNAAGYLLVLVFVPIFRKIYKSM